MSQSLGWADNIIFANAPLSIITAIVSAIRVGGPMWLKALNGRARENRVAAEAELMSSTSHESVSCGIDTRSCGLWDRPQFVSWFAFRYKFLVTLRGSLLSQSSVSSAAPWSKPRQEDISRNIVGLLFPYPFVFILTDM
jgi:hypothetical protein